MKKTTFAILIALASIAIVACKNDNSTEQNNQQNTEITTEDEEGTTDDNLDLDSPEGSIQNYKQQAEKLLADYLKTQNVDEADAMQENFEMILPVLAESLTEEEQEQLKPWAEAFKVRADKAMKEHREKLENE